MAKLYFYYSAMNAGKSTTLLQSTYNYQERGMDTLIFAPKIDQRFGDVQVYSRIGIQKKAIGFDELSDIYDIAKQKQEELKNLRCLLIDEAHFLTKSQVAQLTKVITQLDIAVLCYGLRSDFIGEPFEGSKYLLAWAHEIIEIKTICHCGSKATMNMRIDGNGNPMTKGSQVQIGGNESYLSTCLKHFRENVDVFCEYANPTTLSRSEL